MDYNTLQNFSQKHCKFELYKNKEDDVYEDYYDNYGWEALDSVEEEGEDNQIISDKYRPSTSKKARKAKTKKDLTPPVQTIKPKSKPNYQIVSKKQSITKQQFSDRCKFRYRCWEGKNCRSSHSLEEKEFFKRTPKPGMRRNYKTKPCPDHEKGYCRLNDESWLCLFAHGEKDYTCAKCFTRGHQGEDCPEDDLLEEEEFVKM